MCVGFSGSLIQRHGDTAYPAGKMAKPRCRAQTDWAARPNFQVAFGMAAGGLQARNGILPGLLRQAVFRIVHSRWFAIKRLPENFQVAFLAPTISTWLIYPISQPIKSAGYFFPAIPWPRLGCVGRVFRARGRGSRSAIGFRLRSSGCGR